MDPPEETIPAKIHIGDKENPVPEDHFYIVYHIHLAILEIDNLFIEDIVF